MVVAEGCEGKSDMNSPRNVTQAGKHDVDEEVSTASTLKEDTKRLEVSLGRRFSVLEG